ncbi:cytochrome P450 3A8-like [Exaiptasia diaphana]|uniref:Cytochrome P450 n=1 Tax=Exaiptasia diaphana TaxID=2652724 RepID=A0A913YNE9_EXADI|nr:cytochrome P450 3A8-like [Exaiptasia diaphana]
MDLVFTGLAVFVVLGLVYWYGVKDYALMSNITVTGPKPWPYFGNIPDIIQDGGMHKTLWKYFKRFGRVHKFYVGRRPALVVSDPEMIKEIMVKEFDKFRNRPEFVKVGPPLVYAVGFAQDEIWRRIRTILTPTFSAAKLKEIIPIIQVSIGELEKKLERFSRTGRFICFLTYVTLGQLNAST